MMPRYYCIHCDFRTNARLEAWWHHFKSKGYYRFEREIGSFRGLWRRLFYRAKVNGHTLVKWTEAMRTATNFKKGQERG